MQGSRFRASRVEDGGQASTTWRAGGLEVAPSRRPLAATVGVPSSPTKRECERRARSAATAARWWPFLCAGRGGDGNPRTVRTAPVVESRSDLWRTIVCSASTTRTENPIGWRRDPRSRPGRLIALYAQDADATKLEAFGCRLSSIQRRPAPLFVVRRSNEPLSIARR